MAVIPEWADIDGEIFGKEFFKELQKSLLSSALLPTSTLTFVHREPQKVYKMELIGPQLPAACPYCEEGRNFILQKTRVRKNNRRKNNPDAYNFSIRCGCCGCEGPWSKTPGNAWRLWNMRPTEKKLAEKLEELEQKYVVRATCIGRDRYRGHRSRDAGAGNRANPRGVVREYHPEKARWEPGC